MENIQKRTWGEVYNPHPNVRSKSNKTSRKRLNRQKKNIDK